MKKLILTTAIIMAMGSTATLAHHPAADIVDPEIYAMIDENVSDVHAEMTFDDMGGDTSDVGGARESREDEGAGNAGVETGGYSENEGGAAFSGEVEDVGAATSGDAEGVVGEASETRAEMNSMADMEAPGPGRASGR